LAKKGVAKMAGRQFGFGTRTMFYLCCYTIDNDDIVIMMADGSGANKGNKKSHRKNKNPASSASLSLSSSLSSPSAQHFDVEVESSSAGKRDNQAAAAATKSSRGGGGVGAGDLIYVSPSRVIALSILIVFHYIRVNEEHSHRKLLFVHTVVVLMFILWTFQIILTGAVPTFEDTATILWMRT